MNNNEDIRNKKVTIDLDNIYTKENLHESLKQNLGFPEYYGMNWSAFWDAITGLVELPEKIIFLNWESFSKALPEESEKLKKLLNQFNEENLEWKCSLEYNS